MQLTNELLSFLTWWGNTLHRLSVKGLIYLKVNGCQLPNMDFVLEYPQNRQPLL